MSKLRFIVAVGVLAFLGGCTAGAPEYSWFHPQGGEYLFAYDKDECEAEVISQGTRLGTDLAGPFFTCMHSRGYFLVNGDRIVQAPTALEAPTAAAD